LVEGDKWRAFNGGCTPLLFISMRMELVKFIELLKLIEYPLTKKLTRIGVSAEGNPKSALRNPSEKFFLAKNFLNAASERN
jgi:hypothetical protein